MANFTDSVNRVNDYRQAPDVLRAALGDYYKSDGSRLNYSSPLIQSYEISDAQLVNNQIVPTKKQTIKIYGIENFFRDHIQWNSFINSMVSTGQDFYDHSFSYQPQQVSNEIVKNFHHPSYEDSTKEYPSNQLLNYNLLSYPHDSETVRKIGHLKTTYDNDLSNLSVENLMDQYRNRVMNYSGDVVEISNKQSFIYDLEPGTNVNRPKSDFPYYYHKSIPIIQSGNEIFFAKIENYEKTKNLFKSLRENLFFERTSFSTGNFEQSVEMHDIISLLTSTNIITIQEGDDEIFLLPHDQIGHDTRADRFKNQINAAKLLSEIRGDIYNRIRPIDRIYNLDESKKSIIGYKIEKFINNDATGPIQTYYISNLETSAGTIDFIDSQMKHGSRYIYKTKALIAVFGTSYSYSNLKISQNDFDGGLAKYWAEVDVELLPSFKVIEYELDTHTTAFIDTPCLKPHVTIYGRKDKPLVNFMMQPRFFSVSDSNGQEQNPPIGNLTEQDAILKSLYDLAPDEVASSKYFTGIYEVYRLDRQPTTKKDFANAFLTRVDESVDSGNLDVSRHPIKTIDVDYARFTDLLVPNHKYYYAFRALTYHGTPSQLTEPIEVELQKDSDEYKIVVKEYHYPMTKDYSYQKKAKRLIRILPNIERILFSKEEDKDIWELDEGSLVSHAGGSKTFKIRVTSKHTGKKMDLNLTFKLNKDDTFNET